MTERQKDWRRLAKKGKRGQGSWGKKNRSNQSQDRRVAWGRFLAALSGQVSPGEPSLLGFISGSREELECPLLEGTFYFL